MTDRGMAPSPYGKATRDALAAVTVAAVSA